MGVSWYIYITSTEPAVAAKELEFFVECLVQKIAEALEDYSLVTVSELLTKLGYIK